jgi:hypothetical protein
LDAQNLFLTGFAAAGNDANPLVIQAGISPLYARRSAELVGMITDEVAMKALQSDATARRIIAKGNVITPGQRVGSRLNINVLKSTGIAVNTIHAGKSGDGYKANRGWWDGEVLSYRPAVTLRNAYFNVHQGLREKIAAGTAAKSPMASVDGEFVDAAPCFDGIEVHFNPKREHLFVTEDGCAVRYADEVTIQANSVFARGRVEFYSSDNAPPRAGSAPSRVRFMNEMFR